MSRIHPIAVLSVLLTVLEIVFAVIPISPAGAAPVDATVSTIVSNAKSAAASPYNPSAVTTRYSMRTADLTQPYTGVLLRAKYASGQTLTTSAVVYCFAKKGDNWIELVDGDGNLGITLASASTDVDDGTNKWTRWVRVDAMGGSDVVATVQTAAVSGGAVSIEIAGRY